MWLKCGPTNSNPQVVAHTYVECVRTMEVLPKRIRTDCGNENGIMAAMQCTLRNQGDEHSGASSHLYGSSQLNQHIESWWATFRKGRAQFWMNLFGDLRDFGKFIGCHEHQCLLRYCFLALLQDDLDECSVLWNLHRIRPSRLSIPRRNTR